MKKKSDKKLSLGRIKMASLSKPDQHMIQGGIPPPTSPILCTPTVFRCASAHYICNKLTIVIVADS